MEKNISENGEAVANGSICGYDSLHQLLSENLKPELYQVKLVSDLDNWFYVCSLVKFFAPYVDFLICSSY